VPNIFQKIQNVREQVDYLKRGSAGQGTGVLYDEVVALTREAILEQGIIITTDFLADNSRENAKGSYVYEAFIRVWYINAEDPGDKFSTDIVAHAMDSGDKAPGKAVTYATKTSLVKVLYLETGINDEKRNSSSEDYSDEQYGMFHDFIANKDGLGLHMFTQCISENSQIALYNSFEKGKISSGKKEASELISKGAKDFVDLLETIEDLASKEDPAAIQEVDGFPDYARLFIAKNLKKETVQFLKSINNKG